MSSYIGNQVPDEPIGSGSDEGAHDQDYLQEYRYAQPPRPVATKHKHGDILDPWGGRESDDLTPPTTATLPTVAFAGSGTKGSASQAGATSTIPKAGSRLSQEFHGSPDENSSKAGEAGKGNNRSQSLTTGTTSKRENGDTAFDRASNVELLSTGEHCLHV